MGPDGDMVTMKAGTTRKNMYEAVYYIVQSSPLVTSIISRYILPYVPLCVGGSGEGQGCKCDVSLGGMRIIRALGMMPLFI